MKVLVKSDVYNICNRVKKFDKNYKIIYDTNLNKFQVYSSVLQGSVDVVENKKLSYICTLPYSQLDVRAIKYLMDTSIENIEEIINQIDANNQKLEHENILQACEQSSLQAENLLRQLTS